MNTAITLMLIGMAALVMLNVPIAVALGAVAMAAIWIMQGPQMLPNTALVHEMFTAGVAKGYGDEDIAAAIKTFEELAGVVVKGKKA